MSYKILYTKKAVQGIDKLKAVGLEDKAKTLCINLEHDAKPIYSKALVGNLKGMRSIRINLQHRLVYKILEQEKIIKILSLWGHY